MSLLHRRLLRSGVLFALVFLVLQYLYFTGEQSRWRQVFTDQVTLAPVVALVNLISPNEQVAGDKGSIVAPGVRLSLRTGCDGADAMILLVAAFAAAGLGWRSALVGMAGGLLLIFLLNQARIAALYFSFRYSREWFDLLHGVLGPVLIVAASAGYFFWWLERAGRAAPVAR